MEKTFDAVILANGDFPTHEIPLKVLHAAKHVVCCDGAIANYPKADVVIGDGDSVPQEYHDRLIQVDEQEDNDLTKATRYCLA
ncbi:MAG: thiamine diphosphokinase, partial [Prevotella sp.]|nr:thiamine diphosphokinase [Prevotella sp.]